MSCCPIQACRALLIGPKYVLFEVVVHCLSIAQCTSVLEREPWFIPQVRPYSQTVLKSGLRWSAVWWRGATFYHHRPVDRWVLAEGIDRCLVCYALSCWFFGFVAWISLRANPDDRVVVDGVSIGGRAGPLIRFIVANCLMAVWNMVAEFLSPRWNPKPMIIVRRSSCSWAGRSRSSYSPAVNGSALNRSHMFVRNFL
jgi:hypothetical protein